MLEKHSHVWSNAPYCTVLFSNIESVHDNRMILSSVPVPLSTGTRYLQCFNGLTTGTESLGVNRLVP